MMSNVRWKTVALWKKSVLFGVGLEGFNCSRDSHFSTLRASLVPTLTKSGLSLFVLPLAS